jgi:hypothetical protein
VKTESLPFFVGIWLIKKGVERRRQGAALSAAASTMRRANGRRREEEKAPLICTLELVRAARQGESRRGRWDSSFRRQRSPFRPFPTSFSFLAGVLLLALGVPWRRVVGEAQVRGLGCRERLLYSPESREREREYVTCRQQLCVASSVVAVGGDVRCVTAAGAWVSVRDSHASSPPVWCPTTFIYDDHRLLYL